MAWDQKILPDAFFLTAKAAADAAAAGAKDAAFMAHIQTGLSTSWKRQLLRDDVVVFEGTGTGAIPYTGRIFTVPSVTKTSITSADIDTGEWVHRIINASDSTKYVAGLVTPTAGAGPGLLSGDLVSPNDVQWATFYINGPELDTLSLTLGTPSSVTGTTFTLSVTVAGSIPTDALVLIQWTDSLTAGPWRESTSPPATLGTFSYAFTGATAGSTIYFRAFVYNAPATIHAQTENATFNTTGTVVGTPVASLAEAYATCMTSLNDFPPGNNAGNTDWVNGTWPYSSRFTVSPYGSNVDPINFGQVEPGGVTTDAGYICTYDAATSRSGTSCGTWPWYMTPKGHYNPVGNWRLQVRDHQVAVKLTSLSNAWQLIYGPAQITDYGNNNLGGLRISAQYMNWLDDGRMSAADMNDNTLAIRFEASGGMSFKNIGTSFAVAMLEPNTPFPFIDVAALGITPTNLVAMAMVYWARLIPDTGTGPIPAGVRLGGMYGCDFFDATGRLGTPGQGRLIEFTTEWKPVVTAYVLDPATSAPRQTYSAAATGTWLSANPPPFI